MRLLGALLALVTVVGLAPASSMPVPRLDPPAERALQRSVLTADGPSFRYRRDGDRLAVRGARRGSGEPNRREIVTAGPSRRNQTVCATWARQTTWRAQPGLAVRVVDNGRRVRAVTLTKNIVFGLQSVLNVVTWDTGRRGDPWRGVAQFDMAEVLLDADHRLRPLPWRVCLRVHERRAQLKVWLPRRGPEPSWQDPEATRSTRLPRAFVRSGHTGWYVGHLPARGRMVYTGLSAD